jgi:Domain of unknown function (DUF6457)
VAENPEAPARTGAQDAGAQEPAQQEISQQEILESWVAELLAALELEETTIDIDAVLGLAGEAAHAVVRPAAPLTTFIVGYAAGLAAGTGQASEAVAMRSASAVASRLCKGAGQ